MRCNGDFVVFPIHSLEVAIAAPQCAERGYLAFRGF